MKRLIHISLFYFVVNIAAFSQSSNVYIAPFRNDASGAYSLIHDDFGASYARGIEQYADTMAFNRGIPFSFAVITGQCDETDWKKAKQLIRHGHQVLNHSMNHMCGVPQSWCTFGDWNENDFAVEIDSSTSLIKTNTGIHPAFFVFPFDLYTDTMIAYLKECNYAGARAGRTDAMQTAVVKDPFHLDFNVYRPDQSLGVLNSFAFKAAEQKSWAIRVIHGVKDESWGSIPLKEYTNHLDSLKKMASGNKLWLATLSDVWWYRKMSQSYAIADVKKDAKERVTSIHLNYLPPPNSNDKSAGSLDNEYLFKSKSIKTFTIVVIQSIQTISSISQDNQKLDYSYRAGRLYIEANPKGGELVIQY